MYKHVSLYMLAHKFRRLDFVGALNQSHYLNLCLLKDCIAKSTEDLKQTWFVSAFLLLLIISSVTFAYWWCWLDDDGADDTETPSLIQMALLHSTSFLLFATKRRGRRPTSGDGIDCIVVEVTIVFIHTPRTHNRTLLPRFPFISVNLTLPRAWKHFNKINISTSLMRSTITFLFHEFTIVTLAH